MRYLRRDFRIGGEPRQVIEESVLDRMTNAMTPSNPKMTTAPIKRLASRQGCGA